MKVFNNVKNHGKVVTTHLKRHHKKYIFGFLSVALLYKCLSIVVAYAILHNISFSFANIMENIGIGDETVIVENNVDDMANDDLLTNDGQDEMLNTGGNVLFTDNENTGNISNDEINVGGGFFPLIDMNENTGNNTGNNSGENISIPETPNITGLNNLIQTGDDNYVEYNGNGFCDYGDIEIISPISGDIVGGLFDIKRDVRNQDCIDDVFTIKLWDNNTQYIPIATGNTLITGINFDSTLLMSGYYSQTGLDLSGNIITNYTGLFEGLPFDYFSGHKLVITSSENEIIYEGDHFVIDNKKPELSNIKVSVNNNNNIYAKRGDTVSIYFDSDEELKNIVVNVLGSYAVLHQQEGNKYEYIMPLDEVNSQGKIIYSIGYEDLVGNSGYYEGMSENIVDYEAPKVVSLKFFYKNGKAQMKLLLDELVNIDFNYKKFDDNKISQIKKNSVSEYTHTFSGLQKSVNYDYTVSIVDLAGNHRYVGGNFVLEKDNINFSEKYISKGDLLINMGFSGENKNNTGNNSGNNLLSGLMAQVEEFNICKNGINMDKLHMTINSFNADIEMPKFENDAVKKIVSAFSVAFINKLESKQLTQKDIDLIIQDFNNFLVILKLVKDDNDQCKQNMSKLYINRFKNTLEMYQIWSVQ